MQDARHERRSGEQGFALILAILALMLLTFLGLTLATTTSTELQIATNYRWSQQALYNAEAGLDAARLILSNEADPTQGWALLMPAARPGTWLQGAAPGPVEPAVGRDFERSTCDDKGGMGYGKVLLDATTRYENVGVFPTAGGDTLNGAFTIWIRRGLTVANNGRYSDATDPDELVIVSEGIAPYFGPGGAFTRSRQATRVLETRFTLAMGAAGDPCGIGKQQGQEGGSPMGENFNPCAPITAGAGGSLANAFGGAGAGGLAGTGVQ
jgi:Tfp pilus assembly protein PilX